MVDTSGLRYMEIVQQRDAATFLPSINAHAAPGTVVHTDEWATCKMYHHTVWQIILYIL